jgi:hypothetical protein
MGEADKAVEADLTVAQQEKTEMDPAAAPAEPKAA